MCCFSGSVKLVAGTNIFVRSASGGRQYVVYSMTVQSDEPVAMILPLPVKKDSGEKAVEFISLQEYPDFFADLRKGFPVPAPVSRSLTKSAVPLSAETLEVIQVGDFEASFVPTVKDFSRLDERF